MTEGSDIEFPEDCAISKDLVDNINIAQLVFIEWYSELKPIKLNVRTSAMQVGN